MDSLSNRPATSAQRSLRSRDGCLTCKRRKVKCDESRPRCAHCERLNMECKWAPPASSTRQQRRGVPSRTTTSSSRTPRSSISASATAMAVSTAGDTAPAGSQDQQVQDGLVTSQLAPSDRAEATDQGAIPANIRFAVDQIFDYASFMWENEDMWQPQQVQPTPLQGHDHTAYPDTASHLTSFRSVDLPVDVQSHDQNTTNFQTSPQSNHSRDYGSIDGSEIGRTLTINDQLAPAENHRLIDYFIHAVTPPILVEIETPKKWFVMRRILVKMASASRMVRWALLSFSAQLLRRRDGDWMTTEHNTHYENAAAEVINAIDGGNVEETSPMASESMSLNQQLPSTLTQHSTQRENILAAIFFLSYVDILEGRNEAAHAHLKRAYRIFQEAPNNSLVAVEKQLLLWLRLLDARVASAGGEGLFLSKDTEALLVQASPASLGGGGAGPGRVSASEEDSGAAAEGDMEDVLFQVLYQPGIVFFQKVQSFMGRISNIDPWHRSRGTVEDEIEVMNLGTSISADLRALYEERPLLMDYAVAGRLTAPYVTAHLATVVTRAFRTYLSSYYASKIHLHRVAYKMFPLTKDATEALDQIRHLAKLIAEGLDQEDAMPVSMLWPLLMLGSEEQDPIERAWIKAQILRMEKVAGNARITAQVLEEVQRRQDTAKARVDIRSVMHAIFNSSFAIV